MTNNLSQTAAALCAAIEIQKQPVHALVGLDGFIDEIVHVVDKRDSPDSYTTVPTIAAYAERLAEAAGKSTNIELVLQQVKMGGNGPLLSDALGKLGTRVTTAGALGFPALHPVFEPLANHGPVYSITQPAVTIAAEFSDGKIMHGRMESLNDVTYENLEKSFGGTNKLVETLREADIVALVNWTMIPHLTSVWRGLQKLLLKMGDEAPRHYFFDLCDPQKRNHKDQREALEVIAAFEETGGSPILGLNEKESQEICEALGVETGGNDYKELLKRAKTISESTGIPEVVIHPHTFAVVYSKQDGEAVVEGPYCKEPVLTTGAGDSFNGGYCLARLYGMNPAQAITTGKAVSGFYVRNGKAPSAEELLAFFEWWEQSS